jgi:hypothetical protein
MNKMKTTLLVTAVVFSILIVIENLPQIAWLNIRIFSQPELKDQILSAGILLIPLTILWVACALFLVAAKRSSLSLRLGFILMAAAVFVAMDIVMFITFARSGATAWEGPFIKSYLTVVERVKIDHVKIVDFSDQPILTKDGNPVGVRIIFSVTPNDDSNLKSMEISVTTDPKGDVNSWHADPSSWDYSELKMRSTIHQYGNGSYYADFYPSVIYHDQNGNDCLTESTDKAGEFFASHYPDGIRSFYVLFVFPAQHVSEASLISFPTRRQYSVSDFYQTAVKEKFPVCPGFKTNQDQGS